MPQVREDQLIAERYKLIKEDDFTDGLNSMEDGIVRNSKSRNDSYYSRMMKERARDILKDLSIKGWGSAAINYITGINGAEYIIHIYAFDPAVVPNAIKQVISMVKESTDDFLAGIDSYEQDERLVYNQGFIWDTETNTIRPDHDPCPVPFKLLKTTYKDILQNKTLAKTYRTNLAAIITNLGNKGYSVFAPKAPKFSHGVMKLY